MKKKEIEAELKFCKALKLRLLQKCARLPKGSLHFKMQHGHRRPFYRYRNREKYINLNNSDLLAQLLEKKALKEALGKLDSTIDFLAEYAEKYSDIEDLIPPDMEAPFAGKSRKEIQLKYEKLADNHKIGAPLWASSEKLRTLDGVCLRLRIELIIYEFLKSNEIEFEYERPIEIAGKIYCPDFTIVRKSDGALIIWEHFGMMDDPDYHHNALSKIGTYMKGGYLPNKNFICTFDFGDGGIDMSFLMRIIEMYGLLD